MEKLKWVDFKENNPILDAYRAITVNLQAAIAKGIKFIEVTSLGKGMDKSSATAGLAIVLAQAGNKVLLLDGNLTAPTQHILFDLPNRGIVDAIVTGVDLRKKIQQCPEQENLSVLTSGTGKYDFGQMLGNETVKSFLEIVRSEYDFVLFDVAPMSVSSDALLASIKADGVLLIVRQGEDRINEIAAAKHEFAKVGAKVLGCVLDTRD